MMQGVMPKVRGLDFPPLKAGEVWLVGAGPGDPGLLTLLACHALEQAEVVVHDALIDARIFDLIPAAVERVDVGKRAGRESPRQDSITARLIALARQGKKVVRLKGGDPFVFGRGPEEAVALEQAGIVVRVVPGISAGLGGLAWAGLPLTTREGVAVALVTGHGPDGEAPTDFDWRALAQSASVLVIYMGLRQRAEIARQLMKAGRPADEPVSLVGRAATPEQVVVVTTLGQLGGLTEAELPPTPALMVIGRRPMGSTWAPV
ncbi:MAG: uroporphyrinogen-III C-methyltransferase [Rhodospirillales bacterium]|nr:uroporphyrinogen-III C-methyltransferase [Rhodospirillales bacterium]